MSEPTVNINGTSLTEAQAMTLRVAVTDFLTRMSNVGELGEDQAGEDIRQRYSARSTEIVSLLLGPAAPSLAIDAEEMDRAWRIWIETSSCRTAVGHFAFAAGYTAAKNATPPPQSPMRHGLEAGEAMPGNASETAGAPAPPPSSHVAGWQDISTAPKNTKVLAAYRNELGNWRIVTACYHTQLDWSDEYGDHEQEYAPEDWYEESDSSEVIYPCAKTPTLWMPLPRPDAAPGPQADSVQALLNSLDRTAIAKLVDPSAWINEDGYDIEQEHSGTSLHVADQIVTYVLRTARALATTEQTK